MGAVKLHTYKAAGAGVPSLVISPEGWAAYSFDENDSADGSTEEYHSFTEGDTAHYHYHVITGSNDGTTRYVRYRLHWIIKNIGDSLTYNSTASKVDTIPAGTKALTHRLIDLTDIPVPAVKIGAMYILTIHRDTCGLGDPSVNPWILEAGVHRRVNSDGSTGEYIK
jgi:hypothetical protein